MWSYLLRRLVKRVGIFKIIGLSAVILLCLTLSILALVNQNNLIVVLNEEKAQDIFREVDVINPNGINGDLGDLYPSKDAEGNDIDYGNLVNGNGVNLLLIASIKTEGYVKEMLQLYADSAAGKLDKYPYHFPFLGILGLQYNETKVYDNTRVLKSYIPYDSQKGDLYWGKDWKGISGDKLKLRQINENVINGLSGFSPQTSSSKLPYGINSINPLTSGGLAPLEGPPRDINVFQINRQNFANFGGSSPPANISGYNKPASRSSSDVFYLPDNLVWLNQQFSSVIGEYNAGKADESTQVAMYSMYHNAGPASFGYDVTYGVRFQEGSSKVSNIKEDKEKNAVVYPNDIVKAVNKLNKDTSSQHGMSLAVILLVDNGYYINEETLNTITSGSYVRKGDGYALRAWEFVHGEKLNGSQLRSKLLPYVKTVTEAYPGYASPSDISRIYGFSNNLSQKANGAIFKLDTVTSPAYKNKLNGKDPRVLHVTNLITAGHVIDSSFTGKYIYADMLKYAGVNTDVTNPATYMEKVKNEYVPPSTEFAAIMKKIGADVSDKRIYDMLKWGYDRSGFWYYLGGYGKTVSAENYPAHAGAVSMSPNLDGAITSKSEYLKMIYATTDGGTYRSGTPNSKLVNYGKILFDCSTLTGGAYNATVGKSTGKYVETLARAQKSSPLLRTINDFSQAKTGDLFVNSNHVYFYLATNKGGAVTLDSAQAKRETQTARTGMIWTLEAQRSNTRVGIKARNYPRKGDNASKGLVILRRFKVFDGAS